MSCFFHSIKNQSYSLTAAKEDNHIQADCSGALWDEIAGEALWFTAGAFWTGQHCSKKTKTSTYSLRFETGPGYKCMHPSCKQNVSHNVLFQCFLQFNKLEDLAEEMHFLTILPLKSNLLLISSSLWFIRFSNLVVLLKIIYLSVLKLVLLIKIQLPAKFVSEIEILIFTTLEFPCRRVSELKTKRVQHPERRPVFVQQRL